MRGPETLGERWLALGRIGSALLLVVLTLTSGEAFQSVRHLHLAAVAAAATATLGWFGRKQRPLQGLGFLADIAWVSLAVVGAGRPEAGLSLFFALTAFAAGLTLGGVSALGISLSAGVALVLATTAGAGLESRPGWLLAQGLLVLALGAVSDRTRSHLASRQRALDVASEALERMRLDTGTIVQNLGSGVLSVDGEGQVVHCNRMAEETLGLEGQRVRGRALSTLPAELRPLTSVLEQGLASRKRALRLEVEVGVKGVTVPLGLNTTVLEDGNGNTTGVVALFQDLTEVRRQEFLDRRRDRLAAVGELAAGIAHEIRNSILPISGSVELLAQELALKPDQAKLLEVVGREMENVERFVSGLLRYTRSQELHLGSMELQELARSVSEEVILGRKDRREVRVEGVPARALGDAEQLRQALRNLVLNALDAVGEGGDVILRTGIGEDGRPWIEVEDDGPGIPIENRQAVLQPFHTSKPGGTGLGLAIVARIVEDHEGRLDLLGGTRGGARIRVVLAAAETPAETVRAA